MANGTSDLPSNSASTTINDEPEWITARKGIRLIINDKFSEAEQLFFKNQDNLVMFSGYAFTMMMDALMTFEEDKLNNALSILKEVERRCTLDTGWFKSMAQKVLGNTIENKKQKSYAEQLETQIILADSQVCIAILLFLQQDISGYFKGGWVMRKAWKVYQKIFKEILELYKTNVGELHFNNSPCESPSVPSLENLEETVFMDKNRYDNGYLKPSSSSVPHSKSFHTYNSISAHKSETNDLKKSISVNSDLSHANNFSRFTRGSFMSSLSSYNIATMLQSMQFNAPQEIEKEAIVRLMGAVSFGYGLFQLGVSLLPPSLTRLINLFGFNADRDNGIACLLYARNGPDMRAPLATLCLLWYHTIVRPYYAIDGTNVQAGVEISFTLMKESAEDLGTSSLFLYFQGRAYRLNSDIKNALSSFQKAASNSDKREMKMLCMHEISWCYLIGLDYNNALNTFTILTTSSRWSKVFYCYMAVICTGSSADFSNPSLFDQLKKLTETMPKGAQLNEFLNKRHNLCPGNVEEAKEKSIIYWKLLVFEMLYLWNALPSCSSENITKIINDCLAIKNEENEPMLGLSYLILGCSYCVQNQYDNAILHFRNCLELRKDIPPNAEDAHISAFCQFELASLLIKHSNTKEEGKTLLINMRHYTKYDFESKLNLRVHSALKQC